MPWFGGNKSYDRVRILDDARRAVRRGAHAKAVVLYESVHAHEPDNTDLLRRLAIERARAGQRDEALRDCRSAASSLAKQGFVAQAIGSYRELAAHIPDEVTIWQALAELELERKRETDAVEVLVEGQQRFRSRRRRTDGIALLRRARQIDPTHFEANFQLAGLVARSGARRPALRILEALTPNARTRRQKRRLRGRLFRLSPTPAAAWRWLVALFGGA